MLFQIRKVDAGPWAPFGLDSANGPTGLAKSIEISTDFGLRKQEVYLGSVELPGCRRQPLLIVELNYWLFSQSNSAWAAVELAAEKEALTAFPVEVQQSELGAILFTNQAEHIEEAALCFASDWDIEIVIHGPPGPIAHFPIPADGATFRRLGPVASVPKKWPSD